MNSPSSSSSSDILNALCSSDSSDSLSSSDSDSLEVSDIQDFQDDPPAAIAERNCINSLELINNDPKLKALAVEANEMMNNFLTTNGLTYNQFRDQLRERVEEGRLLKASIMKLRLR